MAEYRPLFLVVTFALLGIAFYVTYRPRGSASARSSKMMTVNKFMLWGVTAFSLVLLFYPQAIMGFLSTDSEITADMQQTVIRIEGMT